MAAASLRALLTRSVDYAGMFPPCNLELEPALKNQSAYARSNDSWMLSALVLPVAQFSDTAALVSVFDKHHPLQISALGARTENAKDFLSEGKNEAATILVLQEEYVE